MKLIRPGMQPSAKGPAECFTGSVRIDLLNTPPPPARTSCASVRRIKVGSIKRVLVIIAVRRVGTIRAEAAGMILPYTTGPSRYRISDEN